MKNYTNTQKKYNNFGIRSAMKFRLVARLGIWSSLVFYVQAHPAHAEKTAFTTKNENAPWSVRLITGVDFALSTDLDLKENGATSKGDGEFDPGFVAGAAFGYDLQNDITLELEYTYRTSGSGDADESVFGQKAESQVASVAIGTNFWYAPEKSLFGNLKPKIGLGIYWLEEVSMDIEQNGQENSFDDSGILYSVMAGLDWEFRESWILGTELRYYNSSTLEAEDETNSNRKLEFDYKGFNALVSVAYQF